MKKINSYLVSALVFASGGAFATVQDGLDALATKKFDVARAHFERETNDGEALYQLALMAYSGLGEAKNENRATELFRRASELGHVRARIQYAYSLGGGKGVPKDAQAAIQQLRSLAEAGNGEAMNLIGRAYKYGWWDLPVDSKGAIVWLEKSAAAGDNMGRLQLAFSYLDGEGVDKNEAEAVRLFKIGSDAGYQDATIEYARSLATGLGGLQKNEVEAFRLIKGVAESGNRVGQHTFGLSFLHGVGTAKDERQAVRWFDAAARQGYVGAQNMMADLFRLGRGVPVNRIEAFKWYTIVIGATPPKLAERSIRLRSEMAGEMTQAATEEGMRRAKEFNVQFGFKPLATPLPDLPKGNSFTLGEKEIKVSYPSGFVNTADTSDVVRRTYPNDPSLAPTIFTMGQKDDMENMRLGLTSSFRQIHLNRAYSANDIEVKDETFGRMKAMFKAEIDKAQGGGYISNVKPILDDTNTYVVSRAISRVPQALQAYGVMRAKGRVFEYHVTGYRSDQESDLHSAVRDFVRGMVSANTGLFGQ